MDQFNIFDILYKEYKITKKIRLIELFAGIGSQAMALRDLGADFEHYRVVEFDKYAIKSYNAIHGTDFQTMDITKIKGADLGIEDVKHFTYLLTYSFPCQDLSVAGKMKGMSKGDNTRSGLLWEVERLLNECDELPQVLLMENVPQVHSQDNMPDFQKWIDFLASKGYSNYWQDLNARDYGVAQNRDRCFMVSILGEYNYKFPKPVPLNKTMKDYSEDNVENKYYITSEKAKNLIDTLILDGKIPTDRQTDRATIDLCTNNPRIIDKANCIKASKQVENVVIGGMQDHQSIKTDGVCTCLTSSMGTGGGYIPMVVEKSVVAYDEQNKYIREDVFGTLTTDGSSPKHNNRVIESKKIKIRQATKDGFVDCEIGGGGGFGISIIGNTQRKSNRERQNMPNTDNGEYP